MNLTGRIRVALLLPAIWLPGCASPSLSHRTLDLTKVHPRKDTVDIFFAANRGGEIEPCGCQARPLGGIEREANALEKWKAAAAGDRLVLGAGTTFTPSDFDPKAPAAAAQRVRAESLVEAMNQMGVQAIAPSARDFALGDAEMQKLEQRAKFPFLSVNLYSKATGRPLFPSYLEIKTAAGPIVILGVASAETEGHPASEAIEVRPPAKALVDAISKIKAKARLVIVLSSLSETEREAARRDLPGVTLLLGGDEADAGADPVQLGGRFLYLNPHSAGKAIVEATLELQGNTTAFFNPSLSSAYRDNLPRWKARLANIESQLKDPKLEPSTREALLDERTNYADLVVQGSDTPLDTGPGITRYDAKFLDLDATYASPNALTDIVKRYKNTVREMASKGEF